jgi:hypothetical protein
MQTKLNSGEIVKLMSDQPENSDYYKIAPPTGAFLWISCEFLKYSGPVQIVTPVPEKPTPTEMELPPTQELPPSTESTLPTFENVEPGSAAATESATTPPTIPTTEQAQPDKPETGVETPKSPEATLLESCYALSTQIDQQLQLPLNVQNYADIRSKLEAIKANEQAGQAATYATILLDRIKRYELAISVVNTLKEQDKALEQKKESIEKTHQETLEKLPKDTNYIFSGILKESHVYTVKTGQQRYLILDPAGKILCYVIPSSEDTAAKLKSMLGLKVGIRGNVSSDKNALKTLISVTSLDLMQ